MANYQDIYITNTGDQWDLIAYNVYSKEKFMTELLAANPEYRDIVVFDAGVRIVCPDIDVESASPLPPWKS
ncbi:MAG: tail protein X [Armatimonadota bacterium]